MSLAPAFDAFAQVYRQGGAQVVWTTLIADLDTPVSAMLKLADGRADSFLFESVERGVRNRYSFVGLKPDLIWRCRGGRAEINRRARIDRNSFEACPGHPLDSLRALVKDATMYVQAGGGIVADSDPATEYQETVNKARALIRAAEEAVRFASGR